MYNKPHFMKKRGVIIMKVNINFVIYIILCGIALSLCCIFSSLLLFTSYTILKYLSLFITFILGIYIVKQIHKYELYKKA